MQIAVVLDKEYPFSDVEYQYQWPKAFLTTPLIGDYIASTSHDVEAQVVKRIHSEESIKLVVHII